MDLQARSGRRTIKRENETIRDSAADESALNAFLRAHRVLTVDRRWVDQGDNSFWSMCVDFLESSGGNTNGATSGKGKIDYKDVLSAEDFAVFAKLRDLRKQIAAYTIFTNEQLAKVVQSRATCASRRR